MTSDFTSRRRVKKKVEEKTYFSVSNKKEIQTFLRCKGLIKRKENKKRKKKGSLAW